MRTLIISVIILIFSNCYSQENKEEFSRWNLSVNSGMIYFLDKDVYRCINEGYYYDLYKSTSSFQKSIWSMNHFECTVSYFFNKNHELGLTLGRGDFTYKDRILSVYSFWGIDTTVDLIDGHRVYSNDWWGFFYNFHYKDYFYIGLKIAFTNEAIESIHIGKNFNLKDFFFIKTEINYSMLTSDLFKFSTKKSEKIIFSFGLGLNL